MYQPSFPKPLPQAVYLNHNHKNILLKYNFSPISAYIGFSNTTFKLSIICFQILYPMSPYSSNCLSSSQFTCLLFFPTGKHLSSKITFKSHSNNPLVPVISFISIIFTCTRTHTKEMECVLVPSTSSYIYYILSAWYQIMKTSRGL